MMGDARWLLAYAAYLSFAASGDFHACGEPSGCKINHGRLAEAEDSLENPLQLLQRSLMLKLAPSDSEVATFMWLTDAHIDPYYMSTERQCQKKDLAKVRQNLFGVIGCDPPPSLLYSVLEGAAAWAAAAGNASFTLFTGDFARHDLSDVEQPWENVSEIIENVSKLTREFFPNTPMAVGALGNDDNPCDYCEEVTTNKSVNPWFSHVGSKIHEASCMTNPTLQMYKYGSFFETQLGNLTILSIATVIYSVYHVPDSQEDDPFGQFAWLRRKLAEAVGLKRRVWIVGHIPPGIETFGYTELWRPQYVMKYLNIVQDVDLGHVIAAQLFGHVHKDEFRLLPNPPPGAGPIILSASISPVYYNNPSFKLVQYNRTSGQIMNFKAVYASMEVGGQPLQWKFGYDLLQTYTELQKSEITMAATARISQALLAGSDVYDKYARWYSADYPNDLQHYSAAAPESEANASFKYGKRRQYVCAMTIQTAAQYQDCIGSTLGSSGHPAPLEAATEMERLLLGRLLSWAVASNSPSAKIVLDIAAAGGWKKLLEVFGDALEESLESGKPLEGLLSSTLSSLGSLK